MAALIDAIAVKTQNVLSSFENVPFLLPRIRDLNPLLPGAVKPWSVSRCATCSRARFSTRPFKASDKFKEPDLQTVEASYLYSDGDGFLFSWIRRPFETLTLSKADGRRCTQASG